MRRFRGRLVFKAHRLLYHSTVGLRVIKKKKKKVQVPGFRVQGSGFRVQGSWCRVQDSGFRGLGSGRNVKRFRGGLVFKARRLLYHSTLGLIVLKKKKKKKVQGSGFRVQGSGFRIQGSWCRGLGVRPKGIQTPTARGRSN